MDPACPKWRTPIWHRPCCLRAREVSRRNSCQENQSKLDGAVQQYILENNLADLAAALDIDLQQQAVPCDTLEWTSEPGQLIGSVRIDNGFTPIGCSLYIRAGVSEAFWHTYPSAS